MLNARKEMLHSIKLLFEKHVLKNKVWITVPALTIEVSPIQCHFLMIGVYKATIKA